MAALANLSFETAGASPGLAASWTFTSVAYAEVAGFGDDDAPVETFEDGWGVGTFLTELDAGDVSAALYSADFLAAPAPVESFEVGWSGNGVYLREMPAAEAAQYDGESLEDFEDGWDNPNVTTFIPEMLSPAVYANAPDAEAEPFETKWKGNEAYLTAFTGELEAAVWAGAHADAVEGFERVQAPQIVTADPDTHVLSAEAHGLAVGHRVRFANESGALPSGLSSAVDYYVRTVPSADTFTVSFTPTGASVAFTDGGTGVQRFKATYENWTLLITL